MSTLRRVANIVLGIALIVCAIVLQFSPVQGLLAVAILLGLSLVLYGLRKLIYFVTMARHMAGGLSVLFLAVAALDIGSFSLVLIDNPRVFTVLYLVVYNMISGGIGIARGIEAKLMESPWKSKVVYGVINILLAMASFAFMGSDRIVAAIFGITLVYNACVRFADALRPTDIIFIQ